jgi:hypothetical protein
MAPLPSSGAWADNNDPALELVITRLSFHMCDNHRESIRSYYESLTKRNEEKLLNSINFISIFRLVTNRYTLPRFATI